MAAGQALRAIRRAAVGTPTPVAVGTVPGLERTAVGTPTPVAVGTVPGLEPLKVNIETLITICKPKFVQMLGPERTSVPKYRTVNGDRGTTDQLTKDKQHGAAERAME